MLFENVALVKVSAVDAPYRIASRVIMSRLRPTLTASIHLDPLGSVAGIHARRFWDRDVQFLGRGDPRRSAGPADLGVPGDALGVLINTSVKAATGSSRARPPSCTPSWAPAVLLNFDVGNACLAFLTGMELVGNMIERGQIRYGMVVDGESSRFITEQTVRRLQPGTELAEPRPTSPR